MELFVQAHQVTFQHGHGDLSHHGNIDDSGYFQKGFFVNILKGGNIDDGCVRLDPFRGHSICLGGDTSHHNRRLSKKNRKSSVRKQHQCDQCERKNK